MDIRDMHYDFKKKLNKVDSQQYKNLRIPEIDWSLNEAEEIFIKLIAFPRFRTKLGFEIGQRNIDDIRTVIVENHCSNVVNNVVELAPDYWHYLKGNVTMSKGTCLNIRSRNLNIRQHDDDFENSEFDKSSFEWREINATFFKDGIKFYTDGTFTINQACIDYLKKTPYMHYAEGTSTGQYKLPSGQVLIGRQDSILPESTHREIVDLAVLLVSGEINASDYQFKEAKLRYNNLN